MNSSKKPGRKLIWAVVAAAFIAASAGGGYYYLKIIRKTEAPADKGSSVGDVAPGAEDLFSLRFYWPSDNRLRAVDRKLPRRINRMAIAEAIVEEYFRGPGDGRSGAVPRDVKLLGIYRDASDVLYVDLSDELRRNFQGDALSEHLLLQGLYRSITANMQDVKDVKLLVEGKETETVAGHCSIRYTLKAAMSGEFSGDIPIADE